MNRKDAKKFLDKHVIVCKPPLLTLQDIQEDGKAAAIRDMDMSDDEIAEMERMISGDGDFSGEFIA